MRPEPEQSSNVRPTGAAREWLGASARAALILSLSWVGFLFVPDRLLAYLSTRVTPHARDALVTLWVAVAFVAMCILFLALQRRRRA